MSERLDVRAEVLKIARLLDVDEAELAYLADVPAADLRDFRAKATDRLFTSAPGLARAAAVAKLIPSKLVASIAQRAFGPVLCARAAGGADPGKAVDVAKHLPPDFLADVAVHLDPRRVATIIAGVPMELVGAGGRGAGAAGRVRDHGSLPGVRAGPGDRRGHRGADRRSDAADGVRAGAQGPARPRHRAATSRAPPRDHPHRLAARPVVGGPRPPALRLRRAEGTDRRPAGGAAVPRRRRSWWLPSPPTISGRACCRWSG